MGVRHAESVTGRWGLALSFIETWICIRNRPRLDFGLSEDGFGGGFYWLEIVVRRLSVTLMSEGLWLAKAGCKIPFN